MHCQRETESAFFICQTLATGDANQLSHFAISEDGKCESMLYLYFQFSGIEDARQQITSCVCKTVVV